MNFAARPRAASSRCRRQTALPQQVLATGQIFVPRPGLLPPCLRPLVVQAPGPHRHAGLAVQPRLHGIAMEDEAVDALQKAQSPRALIEAGWCSHFSCRSAVNASAPTIAFAVDVGRRRHLRARFPSPPPPTTRTRPSARRPGRRRPVRRTGRRRRLRSKAAGRACAPVRAAARRNSPPAGRRSSGAGPTGTARKLPGCRPPGRSSPADRAWVVAASVWNSSRIRGVQFCEPTSQLSMCVSTSVLPANGPDVGDQLAHQAVEHGVGRLLAELVAFQSAGPLPAPGDCPCRCGVWPKRTTVHLPAGTSQVEPAVLRIGPSDRRSSVGRMIAARPAGRYTSAGSGREVLAARRPPCRWNVRRCLVVAAGAGKASTRDVPIVARHSSPAAPASARNAAGLARLVSVQTTFCIDSSGVIHGPPLPHQPASLVMFTSSPSRLASAQTCLNSSRHLRAGEGDRALWACPDRLP